MPGTHRRFFTLRLTRAALLAAALVAAALVAALFGTVYAAVSVTSQTKILASDGATFDVFGRTANSISASGDTVLVGAYGHTHTLTKQGAAYAYVKSGSAWSQQAELLASNPSANDLFAQAVSLDGDVALIGAFFADRPGSHSGSSYIFRRVLTVWTQEAEIFPSDIAEADMFGYAVYLSGTAAVISSPYDDDLGLDSGSVYVYRYNGAAWVQEAKLLASDGVAGDRFGAAVAINGNVIVVGADFDDDLGVDSGSAYIFRHNGSAWVQEAKLLASDGVAGDTFGFSVTVSGDTVVAGAFNDSPPQDKGSAYVFRWNGSAWSQEAKLTASDGSAWDSFGFSVSIDGNLLVVGAVLANGAKNDAGAAYVFQRVGSTWTEEEKLQASDGKREDYFGEAVSIFGTRVVVGAPRDDDLGLQAGSAYIYELLVN